MHRQFVQSDALDTVQQAGGPARCDGAVGGLPDQGVRVGAVAGLRGRVGGGGVEVAARGQAGGFRHGGLGEQLLGCDHDDVGRAGQAALAAPGAGDHALGLGSDQRIAPGARGAQCPVGGDGHKVVGADFDAQSDGDVVEPGDVAGPLLRRADHLGGGDPTGQGAGQEVVLGRLELPA